MKQIATRDRIITFVPSCGTINENVKDNKVRQTHRQDTQINNSYNCIEQPNASFDVIRNMYYWVSTQASFIVLVIMSHKSPNLNTTFQSRVKSVTTLILAHHQIQSFQTLYLRTNKWSSPTSSGNGANASSCTSFAMYYSTTIDLLMKLSGG